MEIAAFPKMSKAAKLKYDSIGAYYGSMGGKIQGYRQSDGSVYAGDWAHGLMHGFG